MSLLSSSGFHIIDVFLLIPFVGYLWILKGWRWYLYRKKGVVLSPLHCVCVCGVGCGIPSL